LWAACISSLVEFRMWFAKSFSFFVLWWACVHRSVLPSSGNDRGMAYFQRQEESRVYHYRRVFERRNATQWWIEIRLAPSKGWSMGYHWSCMEATIKRRGYSGSERLGSQSQGPHHWVARRRRPAQLDTDGRRVKFFTDEQRAFLEKTKKKYDPNNLLTLNKNVIRHSE